MTTDLIFNSGEERLIKDGFDGKSVQVGVYDDSVDTLGENSAESNITTEPTNANYSRVTLTLSASLNNNDNWVGQNSSQILFDFSDVVQGDTAAQDVDAAFVLDDSTGDLIANPSMTTTRNTAAFDELEIAAGDLQVGVDGQA